MIRLNVFIQVEESNRNEVIEVAKELVAQSLKDNGCIFMICETWSDEKALDAHMKAPHFVTLVPRIESLAKMKLEKFEF